MATAAASLNGEPLSLSGNDLADIDLHPVESISDLYWASGGQESHKGTEGETWSQHTCKVGREGGSE